MNNEWNSVTYQSGNGQMAHERLELLRKDNAAVLVLKGAIPPGELERLRAIIAERRHQATISNYVNGSLTTFGPYLARHLAQPDVYFNAAASSDELFGGGNMDLRSHVREQLVRFLGLTALDVAVEPDGRTYAPAIVRVHGDGVSNPLHNDNIIRDAAGSGLSLARLKYQFSCVTCIQECDRDGELLQYRRRWRPEHEAFKVAGGLGYHEGVVSGADVCRFRPESGDIYIMDPTNFHAIRAVGGRDRITMGFFFGFFDERLRSGVCWS